MNILSVDTSGGACSAAVSRDGRLAAEEYIHNGFTHSAMLMKVIDSVLRGSDVIIRDIDLFTVSIGPGSFTGLRIGVSTVKAFSQALNKPIAPIGTLDLLMANFSEFPGTVCSMIDARRSRVYAAVFNKGKKVKEDCIIAVDVLADYLREEQNGPVLLVGDGADIYGDFFQRQFPFVQIAPPFLRQQRASAALGLAAEAYRENRVFSSFDVHLRYLAESQAERNLKR